MVAAGALVTKDVRPYAIVGGNPARELRRRFDDARVDALLAARWWEWPEEELVSIVDILSSENVDELIAYAERREEAGAASSRSGAAEPAGQRR